MPAYTAAQLETKLASYVEPNGDFYEALSQVLPRIYAAGLWRDLTYETSIAGSIGYISLPAESEAVLACTINDNPRPVQSLWHDIRIVGRQAEMSGYFGIVDDGFRPVLLDMKDVQEVDSEEDVVPPTSLSIYNAAANTQLSFASLDGGTITAACRTESDGLVNISVSDSAGAAVLDESVGIVSIESIIYDGLPVAVSIVDEDFPTKVIATIPAGSGVIRYRRFRISDSGTDTTVHLLLKRACPDNIVGSTIIHLGNINAIKHALLGRVAEDNADVQRAEYHWSVVEKLLDAELDAFRGAAKPKILMNIWGASAPYPIY